MIQKRKRSKILKKLGYSYHALANPIKGIYWKLFGVKRRGVKVVIEWQSKILLVKLSYSHKGWTLPGGKVEKNESFEEGGLREASEETGIKLQGAIFIGEYVNESEGKHDTVQCFFAKVDKPDVLIDDYEIVDAMWCDPGNLPPNRSLQLDSILGMLAPYKKSN